MVLVCHTMVPQKCPPRHPRLHSRGSGVTRGPPCPQGCTCMRRMTAWCVLHMWARDGLSIRISTAWMGPAGLRSFMATWTVRAVSLPGPSPWTLGSPEGSRHPQTLPGASSPSLVLPGEPWQN